MRAGSFCPILRRSLAAREKFTGPDQLPDLDGENLVFILDTHEHAEDDGETYNILRCGGRAIWKELAFWENGGGFRELETILKQKYGSRFSVLKATGASHAWLFGDIGVPPFHVEIVDFKWPKLRRRTLDHTPND